jgi:serine/threonine protein kinase
MNNFIEQNLKKTKGIYVKSEYTKQYAFYDAPVTSSQEIVCNRVTDTSCDILYSSDRYKYIENIIDGSASIIYKAYDKKLVKNVIIKKIKKNEYWRKELEILKLMKNKTSDRILKFSDYFESHKRSYIVTDFYDGHDLFEHIDLNAPYNEHKGIKLLLEMAKCIKECHDNKVIHLDIKCENYMVNSDYLFKDFDTLGKIVLIDFGHADVSDTHNIDKIRKWYSYGTTYYLCPEGYFNNYSSSKSDIWSLGICMSLILTGDYPFLGSSKSYYRNSLIPNVSLAKKISDKTEKLLLKCIDPNPFKRPTIDNFIEELEKIQRVNV